MKFPKTDLVDLVTDERVDGYEYITETDDGERRWVSQHTLIFRHGDKVFGASFDRGLTENQHVDPFEDEPDLVECAEYEEVAVTITQWRRVQQPAPSAA